MENSKPPWFDSALDQHLTRAYTALGLTKKEVYGCQINGMNSLGDLLSYYQKHRTFLNLRHISPGFNLTLIDACKRFVSDDGSIKYESFDFNQLDMESIWKRKRFLDKAAATEVNEEFLRLVLAKLSPQLSTRAQNVIDRMKTTEGSGLVEAFHHLCTRYPDFTMFYYCGRKTSQEIVRFCDAVVGRVGVNAEDIEFEQIGFQIGKFLRKGTDEITQYLIRQQTEYNNHAFPIVNFIAFLFQNNFLIDVREALLLKYRYPIFLQVNFETYEQLGQRLGITRERVRQLCLPQRLIASFWHRIGAVINFLGPNRIDINMYGLDKERPILIIDEHVAGLINKQSGTDFTPSFLTKLFSLAIPASACFFCNNETGEYRYIMRNDALLRFDWHTWLVELKNRIRLLRNEDLVIDLHHEILLYTNIDVKEVCHLLLLNEFNIAVDDTGVFTVPKPEPKYQHDKLYHILKDADTELHVNEIYRRSQIVFPEEFQDVKTIRGKLTHHKNLFMLCGTSTYGLREWEDRQHIKEGTIKKLIIDFLEISEEPEHLYSIARHVLRFRQTTMQSIAGIIDRDNSGLLINLMNGFIGLKAKENGYRPERYRRIPGQMSDYIERRYINRQTSSVNMQLLVQAIGRDFGLKPIQVEYIIDKNVQKGKWYIEDEVLFINKSPT
ncbi:MAG TPA: sigma factor-like helix-turn-helix DNA-binding protein [Saprospiraceae bacterium]|nr:sigma factor-like helix-turn-helix DNA-binding protein [Saprospiraceae bacterium]